MAVVLVVAAATAVICQRLRQPVVLGYILAGIIVGPFTPPFSLVQDQNTIATLGEIGVVFLLFGLGLHFDLRKLRAVGTTSIVAGTLQILLMIWIGFMTGQAFGMTTTDSIFLGAIISISSTVIIVKIVSEFGQQDEKWAQIAFGILIIEDILAVCILTTLSGVGGSGAVSWSDIGAVLAKIGVFMAAAVVLGLLGVPRIIAHVAKLPVEEVLLITALGLAAGLAMLGSVFGFSPALGAFIMGVIIAESREAREVEKRVAPVRDVFSAIFFVSVGMLFNPATLLANWQLAAAVTAAVIGGKVVAVSFAVFITGHDPRTSLRAGFSLAQVGEFSFIIAGLGLTLGVTRAPLYEVAVAVAAVTAFTTPLLIRYSPRVADIAAARAPRSLVTFAKLYDTWIANLRRPGSGGPAREAARKQAVRVAIIGAVLTEILIVGSGAMPVVEAYIEGNFARMAPIADVMGWTLLALAALPFAYLYLTWLRQLADSLAHAAAPGGHRRGEHQQVVHGLLRATFVLAGVLGLGAAVLSLASPFVPTLPLLAAVGIAIAAVVAFFLRSLRRFEGRVSDVLAGALGKSEGASTALAESGVLPELQEKYPWGIEQRTVALVAGSWATGKTIGRTRLRARTGATILDIERTAGAILNPPPSEMLEAGDRVVLVGEPPHLEKAVGLLEKGPADGDKPEDVPTVGEIKVHAESPFAGATIAAVKLRERTGATILGVVRGGSKIHDPEPDLVLRSSDVLVSLGTLAQLAEARKLAGDEDPPAEPAQVPAVSP